MSTTVVAQLTGEGGIDLSFQKFAVITVREDVEPDDIEKATRRVSQDDYCPDKDDWKNVDEIELRASLASELKAEGLTLERLEIVPWVWFGE